MALAFLLFGSALHAEEPLWTDNYKEAAVRAQAEGKAMLLDFTGSDWCPWCMRMHKEALDKPSFKDYARKNLVLVEVDFPNHKPQPARVQAQNEHLAKQYGVDEFPTLILVSKRGKVLDRFGYTPGGPGALIAEIQRHYHGPAGGKLAAAAGDTRKPVQS